MQRNLAIDFFRIIAAFFVICIHAPFITWGTNPIYKCAVPIFCLITGYYMNSVGSNKVFFKKISNYLKTLFIAFLVYYVVAIYEGRDIVLPNLCSFFLYNSFGFINAPHLWYLLALIISLSILYLSMRLKIGWIIYCFAPLIIVSPLGKYNIYPFSLAINHFDANWWLTTMPYISIGMIIRKLHVVGGNRNISLGGISLIVSLSSLIFSLVESKFFGHLLSQKSAFYLGTPLYSIGLFLFLLSINIPHTHKSVLVADFCKKASLQIYVWHFLLICVLQQISLYAYLQPFVAIYIFAFLIMVFILKYQLNRKCLNGLKCYESKRK